MDPAPIEEAELIDILANRAKFKDRYSRAALDRMDVLHQRWAKVHRDATLVHEYLRIRGLLPDFEEWVKKHHG
jgi:hypothetical protein